MNDMEWKKVCCPVDFSEPSRAALRVAIDMCQRLGAELTLLHVADAAAAPGSDLKLREWAGDVESAGISLRTAHAIGDPQLAIVDFAREGGFQLIIMGTHGRTGRDHAFAGSVAESVVRRAACPVLTVR
jgi:universal stress protein A